MSGIGRQIMLVVKGRWARCLAVTVGIFAVYYAALMASLIIKFGNLPNYFVAYDWFGNVAEIIRATPSVRDMVPIILDEWLLEIGYMNRDFGNGISEWSLNIIPPKALLVLAMGMLVAIIYALILDARASCPLRERRQVTLAAGGGSLLVALTSATMSWVVCCATPSWIVGLSMLGLGVSTALWLEPVGTWLLAAGFILLIGAAVYLAWRQSDRTPEKYHHVMREA